MRRTCTAAILYCREVKSIFVAFVDWLVTSRLVPPPHAASETRLRILAGNCSIPLDLDRSHGFEQKENYWQITTVLGGVSQGHPCWSNENDCEDSATPQEILDNYEMPLAAVAE